MTPDDARTVLGLMMTADHNCHDCAAELAVRFVRRWPEHRELAEQVYQEAHGQDLDVDRETAEEAEAFFEEQT